MDKHKQAGIATRSALITCIIAAGVLSMSAARAMIATNSTGGTACKAANGNGAKLFNFSNLAAWNTSTTPQYLSCNYGGDVNDTTTVNAIATNIGLGNPTTADISFTCVVQAGTEGYGVTNTAVVVKIAPASVAFTAIYLNDSSTTPAIPARPDYFSAYSFSCQVPAQGKINMVNLFLPGVLT